MGNGVIDIRKEIRTLCPTGISPGTCLNGELSKGKIRRISGQVQYRTAKTAGTTFALEEQLLPLRSVLVW